MNYYLGGYYLLKLRTQASRKLAYTCSGCINDNLLHTWAYFEDGTHRTLSFEEKRSLGLSNEAVKDISGWAEQKLAENHVGWSDVFMDLASAREFRAKFFSHLEDVKIMAIYFDEDEAEAVLEEFEPEEEGFGDLGICRKLSEKITEEQNANEQCYGYDFIGIESGGDFHSFHCHDMGPDLSQKFGLKLNEHNLFDDSDDFTPALEHMNDDETGCEPVPWYLVKVKLIEEFQN